MNTEAYLRAHHAAHPDNDWIGYSDFYQQLLQDLGEKGLWDLVPRLLAHIDPDVQCCGLVLAGTRRPESTEAMLLIAPYMRDAHPLVRMTALHQILCFSWIEPHVEEIAYRISQEEFSAKDPTACVMAMRILLKADFTRYGKEMLNALQIIHDLEPGDTMVRDLARSALEEWAQDMT